MSKAYKNSRTWQSQLNDDEDELAPVTGRLDDEVVQTRVKIRRGGHQEEAKQPERKRSWMRREKIPV